MKNITGPVFPIPTAFDQDGNIDFDELARYTTYLVDSGAQNLMLTVGTSRYNLLETEEIIQVNAAVAKAAKQRSASVNVIVTNGLTGSTRTAQKIARAAEEDGADALILFYPERYYKDEHVIDYYKAVLDATQSIKLMMHEMPMRAGGARCQNQAHYSLELIEKLFSFERVVGMKEESGNYSHSYEIIKRYAKTHSIIIAGAGKRLFMSYLPYGAQSYLVGVGSLVPKLAMRFWHHLQNGELEEAYQIERDFEAKYFDVTFNIGWHPTMKEGMHYLGLMSPYEREPLKRISDKDRKALTDRIDELELKKFL